MVLLWECKYCVSAAQPADYHNQRITPLQSYNYTSTTRGFSCCRAHVHTLLSLFLDINDMEKGSGMCGWVWLPLSVTLPFLLSSLWVSLRRSKNLQLSPVKTKIVVYFGFWCPCWDEKKRMQEEKGVSDTGPRMSQVNDGWQGACGVCVHSQGGTGEEWGGVNEAVAKEAIVSPLRSQTTFHLAADWRLRKPLIVCEITLL